MGIKDKNKFINKISDKDLQEFLQLASSTVSGIDTDYLYRVAKLATKSTEHYDVDSTYSALLKRWVDSGRKDYSVYAEKIYLLDAWVSWRVYSRMQIHALNRKLDTLKSIIDLNNIDTIVDLGAGMGYSTMALNEVFKPRKIYATQLEDTDQYKIIKQVFKQADNAEVVGDVNQIDKADIVFASEYFEHFEKPIDHLKEVLKVNPKMIIVANAFGVEDAIGHFVYYYDTEGNALTGKRMSRRFNDFLREKGYTNKAIHFFNNLPAVFIRKDCLL